MSQLKSTPSSAASTTAFASSRAIPRKAPSTRNMTAHRAIRIASTDITIRNNTKAAIEIRFLIGETKRSHRITAEGHAAIHAASGDTIAFDIWKMIDGRATRRMGSYTIHIDAKATTGPGGSLKWTGERRGLEKDDSHSRARPPR